MKRQFIRRQESTILLLAVIAGLFVSLSVAALDHWLFFEESYLHMLKANDLAHDILDHGVIWLSFILFGTVVAGMVRKRRRVEDSLRISEEKLRLAASATQDGLWDWNVATGEVDFSPAWLHLLGRTSIAPEYESWESRLHPDDKTSALSALQQHLEGRTPAYESEYRLKTGDGNWKWVLGRGKVVGRDAQGRPQRVIGTVMDISERKRAELAREASEHALATLISNLPGLAYRCLNDPHWTMLFVSEQSRALTGYEPGDLTGNKSVTYADLIHPDDRQQVWDNVQAAMNAHCPFTLTYRIVTRSGKEKWVWEQGRPTGETEAGMAILEGFITDVTQRIRAERTLAQSEELFRTLCKVAPVGIFRSDPDGRGTYINRRASEIMGLPEEEAMGFRWGTALHPDDRQRVMDRWEECAGDGRPFRDEYRFLSPGRGIAWVIGEAQPYFDGDGELAGHVGTITEITEQRRTELARLESEERNRRILDTLQDSLVIADEHGTILDANPAACRTYGYDIDELRGLHATALIHPDYHRVFEEFIRGVERTGKFAGATVDRRKDGTTFPTDVRGAALEIDGQPCLMAVVRDVTEQKMAEDELHRSRFQLARAQRIAQVGSWEYRLSDGRIRWSDEVYRIFGLADRRMEITYDWLMSRIHVDDRQRHDEYVQRIFTAEAGKPVESIEYRLRRPDGELRHVFVDVEIEFDSEQRPTLAFGTVQDVTRRKEAEQALAKSEEDYRLLVENQTDMIVKFAPDGRLLFVSPSYCRTFGKTRDELLGQRFMPLIHEDDREAVERALENISQRPHIADVEERAMTVDGWRWQAWLNTGVLDEDGRVTEIIAVGRDITERKRAQEELRERDAEFAHLARLSALGEMVAGIAHEISQPLHAIANYTAGLQIRLERGLDDRDQVRGLVKKAAEQVNLASNILGKYRKFASKHEPDRSQFAINDLLRESLDLLMFDIRELGIVIQWQLASPGLTVNADRVAIHQVIVNLVRNACEAMHDVPPRQRRLMIATASRGDCVEIAIGDHGYGLPPEGFEHLLRPFVTTKPRGMGMGLAVSSRIVAAHEGRLWATPNADEGTTFRFTLPMAESREVEE